MDVDLFELETESDASTLVRFSGSPNWSVVSLIYVAKRTAEGKTKKEIIRCPKR